MFGVQLRAGNNFYRTTSHSKQGVQRLSLLMSWRALKRLIQLAEQRGVGVSHGSHSPSSAIKGRLTFACGQRSRTSLQQDDVIRKSADWVDGPSFVPDLCIKGEENWCFFLYD